MLYTYVCTYIHVRIHVCMYMYLHVCMYMYIHIHICVYSQVYRAQRAAEEGSRNVAARARISWNCSYTPSTMRTDAALILICLPSAFPSLLRESAKITGTPQLRAAFMISSTLSSSPPSLCVGDGGEKGAVSKEPWKQDGGRREAREGNGVKRHEQRFGRVLRLVVQSRM